jgi:hypothetical protein
MSGWLALSVFLGMAVFLVALLVYGWWRGADDGSFPY